MKHKIAIVGEAWGEAEERMRAPFVGSSGYLLTQMLEEAGIRRADCFLTNVFNLRPRPANDIENLCSSDRASGLPALKAGKYLKPEYLPELYRCIAELRDCKPNIAILLGNTATWAFLGNSGISKIRGTITSSTCIPTLKCLPAFHPAAILRDWSLRHVSVLDLAKAGRESAFSEIRRPERVVYIDPSLSDMEWYFNEYLQSAVSISFDIETAGSQITCIGFAPDPASSLVIPFHDPRKPGGSFWPSHSDERAAWKFVRRVLALPFPKTGQNLLYDTHFLWRAYGIPVTNVEDDTMLLHHALQPESQKGLGFLASVYTNESSWKLMRNKEKKTIKRDD